MKTNTNNLIMTMGIVIIFLFGMLIGLIFAQSISSSEKIIPTLSIKVDSDGVSDTTWIYTK